MGISETITRRSILKAAPAAAVIAVVPVLPAVADTGDEWFTWAEKEFFRLEALHATPGYLDDDASSALCDEYSDLAEQVAKRPARTFKGLAAKARLLAYWDDDLLDDEGTVIAPKLFVGLLRDLEALS